MSSQRSIRKSNRPTEALKLRSCRKSLAKGLAEVMVTQNAIQTWRILDINHQENMVVLVSSASPTIKRFGAPSPIANAEVVMEQLHIHCDDGVVWCIQISDGSRKKF